MLDACNKRNIFVVLGFARSGTSVITRGLKALGVDLGTDTAVESEKNKWNPSGFFEDNEIIYNIHTKIFEKLNYKIREIRIIDKAKLLDDTLKNERQNAVNLLKKRYLNTYDFGFKDPNTAKILPFWQDIFKNLNLNDNYIIALRNPLSSAKSFSDVTKIDIEASLILWLSHIIPAIDETENRQRIIVNYDLMMQEPTKQIQRIKESFNIESKKEDITSFTNDYLNINLQHNQFDDNDLKTHKSMHVVPLCLRVYSLLNKVANDELDISSETFSNTWAHLKVEFEYIYPVYCYIDKVLKDNQELKRKIKDVEKSIAWKALHPVRAVDDKLRQLRTKYRNKKRLDAAYE